MDVSWHGGQLASPGLILAWKAIYTDNRPSLPASKWRKGLSLISEGAGPLNVMTG